MKNYKEATLPALNEKHALSMHYRATFAGVVMDVSVDGEAQPAVTGTHPRRWPPVVKSREVV